MWTPQEAETILVEQLGGFENAYHSFCVLEMLKTSVNVPEGFTLIGNTRWATYDEATDYFLFIKDDDRTIWLFMQGCSVYTGTFGETWDPTPHDLNSWLETIKSTNEFNLRNKM